MTTPVRATEVGTVAPPVTAHEGMARRRRRPTGAKPPLPRHLGTSGKAWLLAVLAGLVLVVLATFDPVQRFGEPTPPSCASSPSRAPSGSTT